MSNLRILQILPATLAIILVGCSPPMSSQTAGGATTYTFPIWVTIVWTAVGLVIAFVGWSVLDGSKKLQQPAGHDPEADNRPTETKSDESKQASPILVRLIGLVIIGAGLWLGVMGGVNSYRDKVTLSDDGAQWTVGNWYAPEHVDLIFDEIAEIHTRQEEAGFGRRRTVKRYADVMSKSGELSTVAVDHTILRRLWPDIAAKAMAKGVRVEGDQFTE